MILLAIDTSTDRATVALAEEGAPIRVAPAEPGRRHGRELVPAIRDLIAASGRRRADLASIAVGLGPGSYTGLRIGLTAAKALAYALGRPLMAVDTLGAIARNAPGGSPRISVVVDAQRGDGYVADFARADPDSPPVRLGPTRIEPLGPWAGSLAPGTLVLGPTLDRLRVDWPDAVALGTVDQGHPDPEHLVALALDAFRQGRFADPFFLEPVYLRRSAAEDQWDAKKALGS